MNDMTYKEALKLLNDMQFKDEYQGKEKYTDMLLACKQALDKQIPKKIIRKSKKASLENIKCPNCQREIDAMNTVSYCTYCGQALDWSKIE